MSKSVNKCIFVGNCGKDPETKHTPSGTQVATFSLALSDRQKDGQGNWTDKTDWVNCVAFNKTAEIVHKYVFKGSKLYVEAKFQERSYEKDGQKRYKAEFIVNDLVLLGEKNHQSQADGSGPDDDDISF